MSKARTDMNAEDKGLGQTIAAWFASNGWAQTFPEQWAKSYGVKAPRFADRIPQATQARTPRRLLQRPWQFNRAVAERDLLRVEHHHPRQPDERQAPDQRGRRAVRAAGVLARIRASFRSPSG